MTGAVLAHPNLRTHPASSAASLRRVPPALCHASIPLAACPLGRPCSGRTRSPTRAFLSPLSSQRRSLLRPPPKQRHGLRFGGRTGKGPGPSRAKLGKVVCARKDGRSLVVEPRGRSLQKRALNQDLPVRHVPAPRKEPLLVQIPGKLKSEGQW